MSAFPKYGFKTTHGRTLEAVEPDPRPTPTVVYVCQRRLHVSTLASVLCHRCSAEGDRSRPPVLMEKFERSRS